MSGDAGGVAGVAAAGDEQEVGLGAPAVVGAGADRFGDVLERADAGVGAPVGDALAVVVAVVGGGALRRPLPSGRMRIWTPSQSSRW